MHLNTFTTSRADNNIERRSTKKETVLMLARHALCWAFLSVFLGLSHSALAGQLSVSPLMLTLEPGQNNTTLTLTNAHSEEGYYQLQLFAWEQVDGQQVLTPQADLVVTPPVALIPAGSKQIVRILRQGAPLSTDTEHSYRLFVSELPNENIHNSSQVQVLVRLSLPLFVTGPDQAPALTLSLEEQHLRVENTGNAHVRFVDTAWIDSAGEQHPWHQGLMGYVLPGSSKRWALPDSGQNMTALRAMVAGEEITLPLSGTEISTNNSNSDQEDAMP